MKFLANENFPGPSVVFLRENNIDVEAIVEQYPGITDKQVMELAINKERIILTHDSDYGELIFKLGYKPTQGIIYFRIYDFEPIDPGKILLELIHQEINFTSCLTVVNENAIRQRPY
jgi:predicted nuclease of predicted toxin-antitoxin system